MAGPAVRPSAVREAIEVVVSPARFCCALLLLVGCLIQGCTGSDELRKAERAVATFREAVQRGAFKEIYAAASPEMRSAIGESSFLGLMQAVSGKLGAYVGSELKEHRINPQPAMTLVTLAYVTRFQQGAALERFVFKLSEDRAALVSYNIHSPAF